MLHFFTLQNNQAGSYETVNFKTVGINKAVLVVFDFLIENHINIFENLSKTLTQTQRFWRYHFNCLKTLYVKKYVFSLPIPTTTFNIFILYTIPTSG